MGQIEIKLGGFGGQGIILAGYIIGKASAIFDKKNATLTQSYGPESRGGACSAKLIVSDEEVDYPEVLFPNVLIVMSKEAYHKFSPELIEGGTLLYDDDLVENNIKIDKSVKAYAIPATRMAENLGKKIVANVIMVGFFAAIMDVVTKRSLEEAIKTSIPKGSEELNLMAFQKGFEYGRKLIKVQRDVES